MIPRTQVFVAILAGLLACSVAEAQVRNGVGPMRTPVVQARLAARATASSSGAPAQSNQQGGVIHVSQGRRVASSFVPFTNTFSLDNISGSPGLGFDFPHLAAISRGTGNNSFEHFGHHGHHGESFFIPIFWGGYPYYYDDLSGDQQEAQPAQAPAPQPQIIVIQQPGPERQDAGLASDAGNPSAPPAVSQAAEQIRDVGDFILVRRDGRILFASVFSVVGEQLQYVTPEGIRRTLSMSDLDLDATQQMNEARGTTLQFRN
jgi:hypothetical protein